MTATSIDRRSWPILIHRVKEDIAWLPVIVGAFFAFVLLVTFVVSTFREITVSGWDIAAQIPRWYAGGVGVYLTAVYLPLYIAHGQTRRSIARQLAVFAGGFVVVFAGLIGLGYALEHLIYQAAGWPQTLTTDHLFTSSLDYWLIVIEFTGMLAVWVAGGAMLGAGFYRNPAIGLLLIPVALVMAAVVEAAYGPSMFDGISALVGALGTTVTQTTPAVAAATSAALVVVALAVTWPLVRDMPMRSKPN